MLHLFGREHTRTRSSRATTDPVRAARLLHQHAVTIFGRADQPFSSGGLVFDPVHKIVLVTLNLDAHAAALLFEALHHETIKVLPLDLNAELRRSFDGLWECKWGSPS